jgi:hypothetical protein
MSGKITEFFGVGPYSPEAKVRMEAGVCPFVGGPCIKKPECQGVCAVSMGATSTSVIICPNRLYSGDYMMIKEVIKHAFGDAKLIMGSDHEIREQLHADSQPAVVAIPEVGKDGNRFDWILQFYDESREYAGVAGLEFQSMDTTNNYKDFLTDLRAYHNGNGWLTRSSPHGLNWGNVHKRLIPQLISKGNLIANVNGSRGLFFVVPEVVFERFERVLPGLKPTSQHGPRTLTVLTVVPSKDARGLSVVRTVSYDQAEFSLAFARRGEDSRELGSLLHSLSRKYRHTVSLG